MIQLKRFLLVTALGLASACFPTKPPEVPGESPIATRAIAITIYDNVTQAPISGAVASLSDVDGTPIACASACVSNADGYVLWPVVRVGRSVTGKVAISAYSSAQWTWTITPEFPDHRVGLAPVFVPSPSLPRLHVSGTEFRTDADARFIPLFASELSILRRDRTQQIERLKEVKALGFNGIRVFAGMLTWAGQTPEQAQTNLGWLLDAATEQGLYVLVTALTDTAAGYDAVAHLWNIAAITKARTNTLYECFNEGWHPSQSYTHDFVAAGRECATAIGTITPWSLGDVGQDEPSPDGAWPFPLGSFVTVHLDRSRESLNMVRRVRELHALEDVVKVPVWNSEPIKFIDQDGPDEGIAFAMGALDTAFGIDGLFHSQNGLDALPFSDTQRIYAKAFVEGFNLPIRGGVYHNAGQVGSPVKWAHFVDPDHGTIVRAYSFTFGDDSAYVIVLHESKTLQQNEVEFRAGWEVVREVGRRDRVTVLEVKRTGADDAR